MFLKFNKISIRKRKVIIDICDFNIIFILDFFLKQYYYYFSKNNSHYRNEYDKTILLIFN